MISHEEVEGLIENNLTGCKCLSQKVLHNSKDVTLEISIGNMSMCIPEVEQTLMELLWLHRARWASFKMRGFYGGGINPWRTTLTLSKPEDKAMPRLRSLGLSLCMMADSEEFFALFAEAPALKRVSRRGFPAEDEDAAIIEYLGLQWDNVRTLALSPPENPSEDLPVLFDMMRNVTVLYLSKLDVHDVQLLEVLLFDRKSYTQDVAPSRSWREAFMLADTPYLKEENESQILRLSHVDTPLLRTLKISQTTPQFLTAFLARSTHCDIIDLSVTRLDDSDSFAEVLTLLSKLRRLSLYTPLEPEVCLHIIQRLGALICPAIEDVKLMWVSGPPKGVHSCILKAIADFLEARWPAAEASPPTSFADSPSSLALQTTPRHTTRPHLRFQAPTIINLDEMARGPLEPALQRAREVVSRLRDTVDVDIGYEDYKKFASFLSCSRSGRSGMHLIDKLSPSGHKPV